MPTLNWIGKEAVVRHHQDVPFRLLEPVPELACGESGKIGDSGNLIVHGDNLHALKALLPRYAGQVKCIYIDPPYNTGNEGWAYNGILRDRSVAGGNVLTGPAFAVLPKFDGPKVIYAAANRMGARAARAGISFRQTPYALDM